MKTKLFLLAAVMILAFTVSAFPQASYTVSQETMNKVACCGLAEPTGSIAFNAVADSPVSVTGTITLNYNLPIANAAVVGLTGVRIIAVGAGVTGTQPVLNVYNATDTGKGVVVITVPVGYTYPNSIRLSNVRVNVSGSCDTATGAVEAHASSTGNLLTIGETEAISLVKAVGPALVAPTVTTPIAVNAATGVVTGSGTTAVTFSEAFLTAFGITSTFPDDTRTYETLIRLKVSAIPTGVTIRFYDAQGIFRRSSSTGVVAGSDLDLAASAVPQYVYYVMAGASNPAGIDTLPLLPGVLTASPFPLAPANITISASLAPLTTGATATAYPSYVMDTCETTPVTFVTISGALNTILLVPYATTESGYNTALTVANTTKDPGTVAMGTFPTAILQTGKITIYFYPKNGATIAPWVSTAHPSEFGLDSAGKLPAGGTFVALLDAVLPSSVTEFGGYVFIVTDFTNAHGEFFVSNFDFFTHGALMLVVNDIARVAAGRTQEQGLNQ